MIITIPVHWTIQQMYHLIIKRNINICFSTNILNKVYVKKLMSRKIKNGYHNVKSGAHHKGKDMYILSGPIS